MTENPPLKFVRKRTRADLSLVAQQLISDGELLFRFKAAFDLELREMEAVMNDMRRQIREIDPGVTIQESTRIIAIVADLVGKLDRPSVY